MFDISTGGAFLAGLISFVSPCVLPIVPPYLCFIAGVSVEQVRSGAVADGLGRRIVVSAIFFVLGFATVFIALGATASLIGQTIAQWFDVLSIVAGAVIAIMGLHFLGVFRIGLLYREARVEVARKPPGLLGAYVLGLAFAFGWTPCVGPVLAAILFMAGAEESAGQGAVLLAAYAAGIGLPFILAAAFASRFLGAARRFNRYLPLVEKVMGGMLVVTGVLFMTGQMSRIAQWLLETFPVFATIG
jgi:cytochrome c-type biogenesis protein